MGRGAALFAACIVLVVCLAGCSRSDSDPVPQATEASAASTPTAQTEDSPASDERLREQVEGLQVLLANMSWVTWDSQAQDVESVHVLPEPTLPIEPGTYFARRIAAIEQRGGQLMLSLDFAQGVFFGEFAEFTDGDDSVVELPLAADAVVALQGWGSDLNLPQDRIVPVVVSHDQFVAEFEGTDEKGQPTRMSNFFVTVAHDEVVGLLERYAP